MNAKDAQKIIASLKRTLQNIAYGPQFTARITARAALRNLERKLAKLK